MNCAHNRRIVLVCPRVVSTFISEDARALEAFFKVKLLPDRGPVRLSTLWRDLKSSDCLLLWFLGRHAIPAILLARVFKKPIVSIIGGFEVAWVPEIDYGIPPGSFRERILGWMLKHSTRIVVVSERSRSDALSRFPELAERMDLVYNAVDTSKFENASLHPRAGVITVGRINQVTLRRKGLGLIRDTAANMPHVPFSLIGPADDEAGLTFVRTLPSNMLWKGALFGAELVNELQRASVYVQASVYESFCVALAEAMACGCIPVIAPTGALPEVGGPSAIVMRDLTVESLEAAIREGFCQNEIARSQARAHILAHFSLSQRAQRLADLLNEVIDRELLLKRPR